MLLGYCLMNFFDLTTFAAMKRVSILAVHQMRVNEFS